MPKTDPVHKVTVIPRGRALGVTMQLPEGDRYSLDKERMLSTHLACCSAAASPKRCS